MPKKKSSSGEHVEAPHDIKDDLLLADGEIAGILIEEHHTEIIEVHFDDEDLLNEDGFEDDVFGTKKRTVSTEEAEDEEDFNSYFFEGE